MDEVIVVGGGGHAKVVIDAAVSCGLRIRGIVDDDASLTDSVVLDCIVLGTTDALDAFDGELVHGIGDNRSRSSVAARLGDSWRPVLHRRSIVSDRAVIEPGVVVLAGAVVQADAHLEEGVIVNTAAIVEHDVRVGAFAHIAPNATVTGGARVGRLALVGAGSVVLPGVEVGAGAVVGSGAVVTRDVAPHAVVVGVPARGVDIDG